MKIIILTLVIVLLCINCLQAQFSGGNGTSSDPWQISNEADLSFLSTNSGYWGDCYIQTANLNPTLGSLSPIGINYSNYFSGSYDGDGHTVDGLNFNNPSSNCLGLFGYTNNASISNLGVTNVSIIGNNYVGGLVGFNHNTNSTVTNCYSTGSVTGSQRVGGLVGDNNFAEVTKSYSTCSVTGNSSYTGGLVGWNTSGEVTESYSTGSVNGVTNVGGLVGSSSGNIFNCYSTSSVTGTGNYVGGLVGYFNTETLTKCYSTGSVSGGGYAGGLVGYTISGTVSDSFWDTQKSGQSSSSGGTPKDSTEMKTLSTFTGWDFDVDGISAGHNGYWIMAGYPHLQMEWSTTISDDVKLQMMALALDSNYTLSGNIDASGTSIWNYNGSTYDGFSPIGNSTDNFTGSYDGDDHTIDGLFINTPGVDYCGLFGYFSSGGSIIDLGLTNVSITGNNTVGALVGQTSGTTTNCYSTGSVTGNQYVGGLVGNSSGAFTDCYSTVSVNASGDYTGGLIGCNWGGSLTECYSTGNVTGSYNKYVGGLVGRMLTGPVTECFSTGSVTGTTSVGGLIGYNEATVNNCYSTGSVTGTSNVGGLMGWLKSSPVGNCYSTGSVTGTTNLGGLVGYKDAPNSSNCFWDYETSGTYTSATGSCRSTDSMKMQSTFTIVGWSPSIWYMDPGADFNDGYPYLEWQNPGGTPLPVGLISFNATVNKNDVTLNWRTAWEINNAGFDVERQSLSGKKDIWTKIGYVEGNGTINEPSDYTFQDRKLNTGKYNYRLVQRDYNNRTVEHFLSDEVIVGVPKKYFISQNYPNPFNPVTKIDYELPVDLKVSIKVFDMLGRKIATLVNGFKEAGYHTVEFDGSKLSSGVYFYKIETGNFHKVKRMLLIK